MRVVFISLLIYKSSGLSFINASKLLRMNDKKILVVLSAAAAASATAATERQIKQPLPLYARIAAAPLSEPINQSRVCHWLASARIVSNSPRFSTQLVDPPSSSKRKISITDNLIIQLRSVVRGERGRERA